MAHAVGTPAGTPIQNTAQVSYSVSGSPASASSNQVTVLVAEVVDVVVTLQSPPVSVSPGAAGQALVFLVTNTGNGPETFRLTGDSALTGDDFDPVPASPVAIYFDTDGSATLTPADTPYAPGTNDPVLAPDASVTVLYVNDIPPTVTNGQRGRAQLEARALTGTGAPGTLFPGQGVGGVDALVGTTGGDASAFGEYVVGDIALAVVLSQLVIDQFGGSTPVPGATIEYTSVVTATGTGTAVASMFSNAIPPYTTYTPGSLTWNGAPLSDAADADAGEFVTAPTAGVRVALGDLTSASPPQTIVYRVTIN